jgi:hypothetical protein
MTDDTYDFERTDFGDESLFTVGQYGEEDMVESMSSSLATKEVTPSVSEADGTDRTGGAGPIKRLNETLPVPGARSQSLESFAFKSDEISKVVSKQTQEVWGVDFPALEPVVDEPDTSKRDEWKEFLKDVNEYGQSLHGVMTSAWEDHARLGTAMVVLRRDWSYNPVTGELSSPVVGVERVDPKVVVPVADENNTPGGLYACPIHRENVFEEPQRCDECDAPCKEAEFARVEKIGGSKIEHVLFREEVITWAFNNSRFYGRDGLSPVANIWTKAWVLQGMTSFVSAFFDDDNGDKFPNKLMVIKTSNGEAVEKRLQESKDSAQQSPYEQGALFLETDPDDTSFEVIDLMSDELLGQQEQIRKEYKRDIRGQYGLVNAQGNEEGATGLARGSVQLKVLNRTMANIRADLQREVLDRLTKELGIEEYKITFGEAQDDEDDAEATLKKAETAKALKEAGIPFKVSDGNIEMVDTQDPTVDEEVENGQVAQNQLEQKADPSDLSVGDWVEWQTADDRVVGQISGEGKEERVEEGQRFDGEEGVADVFRIDVWDDEAEQLDESVIHPASELSLTDEPDGFSED